MCVCVTYSSYYAVVASSMSLTADSKNRLYISDGYYCYIINYNRCMWAIGDNEHMYLYGDLTLYLAMIMHSYIHLLVI